MDLSRLNLDKFYDAQSAKIIKLGEINKLKFAFDHKGILEDYLKYKKSKGPF
jgi:hypothetical protein